MRLDDERGVALAEVNLAACRLMGGDEENAAALAERSLRRVRRLDLRVVLPYVMAVNAHAILTQDPTGAASLAREAARLAAEQGLQEALCTAGLARACALAADHQPVAALQTFAAVDAFARMSGMVLPPWFHDRAADVVRRHVDRTQWDRALEEARSLTASEAEAALCA